MAPRPDLFLPVEAQGSLRLDAPTGRSVDVRAEGGVVRVIFPGWPELRSMLPGSSKSRSRLVRRLSGLLRTYGMTISLESAEMPFLEIGYGTRPSLLARLLGLGDADLRYSAIRFFFRR